MYVFGVDFVKLSLIWGHIEASGTTDDILVIYRRISLPSDEEISDLPVLQSCMLYKHYFRLISFGVEISNVALRKRQSDVESLSRT